ncbi:glycosyl hydrolase [Pedobacter sp. HMF7647]|uniref:Glycosyl hydrolase n=1 Tax=Hufsiella arboris TaxID=2695275 RepID=A0A7K1Y6P7_9SPHI|nr:glycoside hydrolase family 127 protein [Hufsiella arboris]MXV50091.1 glycosyl hydrolase [Hufsiella arboris]
MKKSFALACSLCFVVLTYAQAVKTVQLFPMTDVQLLPSIFLDARSTDLKYIMALSPDRLLAPYLREAGLTPKAESYTNWENTGLDGHIGGHYLSALAMMQASTGDKQVEARLNYMLSELKKCQDKNGDGYIGGVPGSRELWQAVFRGDIDAVKKKWVPLYNIHKTYAGIRDAYLIAGNAQAKDMLIKFSDWFVHLSNALSTSQLQEMLNTEHGGINEVLADVYSLTKDKKYLDAAYKFSHQAILNPLEHDEDELNNLHANTQIPKIIGFERIAIANNDAAYEKAADFFWETVVNKRSVAIGGNSVREHFNPANNFTSMITSEQGPETCNTYNMLKLTELLYESNPSVKYIDYYERAMYNHILSTQHPGKGGFVYFTPMRPGHYRVYSQPQTSMWCCVGSGMENHAKYNELIYAHSGNDLYVNLFVPSRVQWREKGLVLTQINHFPEEERTMLRVESASGSTVNLKIRYPSWVKNGALKILVNGKLFSFKASASEWITLQRNWKKGDKIDIQLPMHNTIDQLPDGLNFVAILHGPIVLAAKTDTANMAGLFADDSRMGHVASGRKYPLQQMPMFVSDSQELENFIEPVPGKPLTFKASNLIQPASYASLELVPFYKVHDSRYVIYWEKETPAGLQKIKQEIASKEAAAAKLDSITVDLVTAGEQQPESDHFFKSENSVTGVFQDRHWRSAKGWFSYQMKAPIDGKAALRLTYYGEEKGRSFLVKINDKVLAEVNLDGSHGDTFYSEEYVIPAGFVQTSDSKVRVKLEAVNGSATAGVYEIRMIRK